MNRMPQPEPAIRGDDLQFRSAQHEELIRQEQRSNDAKREFLLNISHDIRTPMNAIIGFTDIALRQNPDEIVRRCLENISASSEHLLSLINDMLDISRASLYRAFTKLENDGFIEREGKTIMIKNREKMLSYYS